MQSSVSHSNLRDERDERDERVERVRPSEQSTSEPNLMLTMRQELVSRIWGGMLAIVVFGVPMSVLRSIQTGWMNMYTAHLVIGAVVVGCFLARNHLSLQTRTALLLLIFWSVGLIGLVTLGLLGAGLWWLAISCLLVSVLVSMRWGVISMFAVLLAVLLVGAGFISGRMELPFDANLYIRNVASWFTVMIGTILMPIVVFQAIAGYQRATQSLLEKVEAQHVQIKHMATHDQLTGLPRMNLASDRLVQALLNRARRKRKVALLFIDLDGFKQVNDEHGHDAGDTVLRTVAERMSAAVRGQDTVARKGGDEFITVLEDVLDMDCAMRVAHKLIEVINQPVFYKGRGLQVGASIGVALAPDHAVDALDLIKLADTAMYDAKHQGKNQAQPVKIKRPKARPVAKS